MDLRLEVVQVPVADVDRAKAFYTDVVGFHADHDHAFSDAMRVVQLTPPGSSCSIAIGSGLSDMTPGSLRGLQLVVTDMKATRAELVDRGLDVSEIEELGRPGRPGFKFAYFSDPDGNGWVVQEIPINHESGASMTTETPVITGVDFVTVFVDDYAAAMEFYGTTLGLSCSAQYGRINGCEYETGSLTLQLMEAKAIGREFAPSTHPIALHVEDVEAARTALEGLGVEFFGDTIDSGVCRMAFFNDPDGNSLMFHHRYAPRTPAG